MTDSNNTLPSFPPGWCPGCTEPQGIYVAVAIAVIGLGVLVGFIAMLWGIYKGTLLERSRM
jgi:hypothetical protein